MTPTSFFLSLPGRFTQSGCTRTAPNSWSTVSAVNVARSSPRPPARQDGQQQLAVPENVLAPLSALDTPVFRSPTGSELRILPEKRVADVSDPLLGQDVSVKASGDHSNHGGLGGATLSPLTIPSFHPTHEVPTGCPPLKPLMQKLISALDYAGTKDVFEGAHHHLRSFGREEARETSCGETIKRVQSVEVADARLQ